MISGATSVDHFLKGSEHIGNWIIVKACRETAGNDVGWRKLLIIKQNHRQIKGCNLGHIQKIHVDLFAFYLTSMKLQFWAK